MGKHNLAMLGCLCNQNCVVFALVLSLPCENLFSACALLRHWGITIQNDFRVLIHIKRVRMRSSNTMCKHNNKKWILKISIIWFGLAGWLGLVREPGCVLLTYQCNLVAMQPESGNKTNQVVSKSKLVVQIEHITLLDQRCCPRGLLPLLLGGHTWPECPIWTHRQACVGHNLWHSFRFRPSHRRCRCRQQTNKNENFFFFSSHYSDDDDGDG